MSKQSHDLGVRKRRLAARAAKHGLLAVDPERLARRLVDAGICSPLILDRLHNKGTNQ